MLVNGHVLPNPLLHARKAPSGEGPRDGCCYGLHPRRLDHRTIFWLSVDDKESLEGYYLIDFALFKDNMPLLYDQRYLEMSYLMLAMSQVSFAKCLTSFHVACRGGCPDPHKVPIEVGGVAQ